MDKLKNISPAYTSLFFGLAGAVLVELNKLMLSGDALTAPSIAQSVLGAIVAYLMAYGLGIYHQFQPVPGAGSQQPDNEANLNK